MIKILKRKNKLFRFIFIYFIFGIILTIVSFIYALLIHNETISLTNNSFKNISFIIGIILFLILGLISGIVSKKNGLVEGMLSSLIIIAISILLNLIMKVELQPIYFIKLISYLISSMAGGIIGVNIVNKNK